MDYIKPLTPSLRRQINDSIDKQIRELDECQSNVFVNSRKIGLQSLKNIIRGLPDGYPIPMTKEK